jgi:flagellin
MTRINTNVSSLIAQTNLSRVNNDLQTRLTRLSTGLRINSGKDDPAGLIASENLRRDITSLERAISNTERANQVIATADSALGQVSSLLNDIRGLVVEAANTGALSEEQIAANQLQVDSSLEAINRIAQTTEFQGRKLLNGSLDFTTTPGANFANITDLQIDQANLGATGSVAVAVEVTTAATQATVEITGIDLSTAAAQGVNSAVITATQTEATGTLTLNGAVIDLTALPGGTAAAAEGNEVASLAITFGAGAAATSYTAATNTLNVSVTQASGVATIADIQAAIAGGTDFSATVASGGTTTVATGDDAGAAFALTGGQAASADTITITTVQNTNDYNATGLTFIEDTTLTANTAVASYNSSTDNIEVRINGERTYAQIATAISALDDFTAAATTGTATVSGNSLAISATAITATVTNTTAGNPGGLSEDVVFELSGLTGSEVFNFQAGTSLANLVSSINLFTDATGITAVGSGTTLTLNSSAYGSRAFVDVKVLTEDSSGDFTTAIGQAARDTGSDAVARINGLLATADGNKISINTPALDLSSDLAAGFTGTINFNIIGGGALFQIGPDVVSNQQARIGITSLNTGRLGGTSGKLYQLQSGGSAALAVDATLAANIVDEAIDKVTGLRGRLGAFQKTTLESNIATLNDTVANLTEAESSIRDADFAEESAKLTRAQILTQSTTSILAIANSNPQNVLALLGR